MHTCVRLIRLAPVAMLLALTTACATTPDTAPPPGTAQPDRFLFDRGTEELAEGDWDAARTYFQQVVDNYPQSPVRPEAKLGVGDAYLGSGNTESLILAAQEFREFLAFYPTSPRADYAQYKLAMSHFEQMRAPDRDQTETRNALREFDAFFQRYPNSPLMPEVKQNWRIARDRLSEASYRVGLHYFRQGWYPGAIDRFRDVLAEDPAFSGRDALYYYLAESLARTDNTTNNRRAEAVAYFQRLLDEFEQSEHLADARQRLQELQNQ